MDLVLALAAAACFALASVLQQVAAEAVPQELSLRPGLLLRLLRSPVWLAGKAFDFLAVGLQALALRAGALVVVQPVLASGLLIALPLSARLAHRRLTRRDVGAALVCFVGLAAIVAVAEGGGGIDRPSGRAWAGPVAVTVTGLALAVTLCRLKRFRASRPLLLGVASGVAYGLSGAFMKATMAIFDSQGLAEVILSWEPYAMAVAIGLGAVVVASAFQAGPLAQSLPALTAMEPVVAVGIGVTAFAETLRHGTTGIVIGLTGAALALSGAIYLARSSAAAEEAAAAHPLAPAPAATGHHES